MPVLQVLYGKCIKLIAGYSSWGESPSTSPIQTGKRQTLAGKDTTASWIDSVASSHAYQLLSSAHQASEQWSPVTLGIPAVVIMLASALMFGVTKAAEGQLALQLAVSVAAVRSALAVALPAAAAFWGVPMLGAAAIWLASEVALLQGLAGTDRWLIRKGESTATHSLRHIVLLKLSKARRIKC